ncbi:autotransporter domain-containing protein [Megasphaera elsdenii]|uniref:autotransporter domain-containing protein n=1 Tax=Megasphaera elsdenii TaxID=907 RepID=UPI0022E27C79|nr:autotransporter domain-containing protein [Megasphaera elsdenii]
MKPKDWPDVYNNYSLGGGRYGAKGYTINVQDGKSLTIKNLYMNNPVIKGNGDITLQADDKSLFGSGKKYLVPGDPSTLYGNSLLVTGKGQKSEIQGNNISIINTNTAGSDGNGIFMDYGSSRNLIMDANNKVYVSGARYGIASENETSGDISIKANSMDVVSKGWGIFINGANKVDIDATHGFTINGGQGISNNGSEAITVKSTDGDTYIKAGTLFGVTAQNGSISITAKNNTVNVGKIPYTRDYYAGIRSFGGNVDVKATDGNNTITTGTKVDGAYAVSDKITIDASGANEITAGQHGLRATKDEKSGYTGGTLTLHAGKYNIVKADQNAMYATYDGVITVKSDEERSMMEGNVTAETGGQISADYNTSDSYLLGKVTTDNGETTDSSTTLNFKNGGQWLVTGDSNVTNVDFSGGIINMTQNSKGNAHQVSIDKALNGSGTFMMDLKYLGNSVDTYKNASDSDFVYIHGGDGSTQQLSFTPGGDNLGSMHSGDKLYFAEIANGAANFASDTVTNANKSGIYDQQFMINSEGTSSNYKDWFITCLGNTVNPNGDTPIASHHAGFALWRDDDTLLKRLGELRYSSPDEQVEDGIWARLIGKKLSYQHSDYGFVTHAKTLEVGYDKKKLTKDQKGTWWRGVALGHTWGRTDFNGGSGDNDFTDFKYYSTNIRQHDHYMDFVARIGRLDSDYDTNYGDHADYKNWAGSLSIEYGRKKKINKRNWYIEPQSQLTYSYIWGRDYTTKNGISVHQDDADSLVGRLGFVLSREFGDKRPDHNRLYLKASVLHEFLGNNNDYLDYNGTYLHDDVDLDGTWYILGAGFNADISNNCNFYFDIEKAYNSDIDLSYRIEGGFRWEW